MRINPYSPAEIEAKWQRIWAERRAFCAQNDDSRPKFYGLIEFPYPSGEGLHVGHPRSNTAIDIIARKRRMEGYNVLFPMGWDAFGLPTENYAIKNKIHPRTVTEHNVDHFRAQLQRLGFSFDWSREVDTTDPAYYKWTQWIFLKLYEHGLAYKAEMPINWCVSCKCGLANEEVVDGACERCGGEVVRRVRSQWMLRITEYAQKLLDGLDEVDFIEKVKTQQRNWIGRSEGAEVDFAIEVDASAAASGTKAATSTQAASKMDAGTAGIRVFTTRPDTLFGATYMVLAPEHPLVDALIARDAVSNAETVAEYRAAAARKSDFERTELAKDKTGVPLEGVHAVNPATGKPIPVWISDYVLVTYGTGAIMAVPGHDARDWAFARKFGLPIVEVVAGGNIGEAAYTDVADGVLVNSGFLNGLRVAEAKQRITGWLVERGLGERKINYKLRDWVFSRQRYWGEPIPIVECPRCGFVPVPEDQLPVTLPEVERYEPTDSGESPLAAITDWVNTACLQCGGPAKRETDTMPQWAGSSWYFMRYADPHNTGALASKEALAYWLPVDWYNGGMEHTTLHLLYSRFWYRFLYDIGIAPNPEPYRKRTSHGMILGDNGEKMSKSRGNVINPDVIVAEIGADAFRLYEMFMGAFDQAIPWSTQGAHGCRRFLERVWRLQERLTGEEEISKPLAASVHGAIKKVSEDYERMKYNTAIAAMMTLVNDLTAAGSVTRGELRALLLILSPVAPHIAEEMWEACTFGGPSHSQIYAQPWPAWDEAALRADTVEIAVQINGKVRARIDVPAGMTPEEAAEQLPGHEKVAELLAGRPIRKLVFVPGRLLNIVV